MPVKSTQIWSAEKKLGVSQGNSRFEVARGFILSALVILAGCEEAK